MLTKADLKEFKTILREEIEAEGENIRSEIQAEIQLLRMDLSLRMDSLENCMNSLEYHLGISPLQ